MKIKLPLLSLACLICLPACGDQYSLGKKKTYPLCLQGPKGDPGQDGIDGKKGAQGAPGEDGQDAAVLLKKLAKANRCTSILPGMYIENIQNGEVFDVYFNDSCDDSQGEYCDNVVPSEATTGKVDQYRGSGTVCWADNYQISGVKQTNGDILVYILEFSEEPL